MSAAARLLAGLERRGVEVSAIGGALHYTCTKAALGPADVADLRHHKAELIALLARRECPAARLDRLWTEALARAGEGFARAGAAPPERALLAAARIELDLLEDLVPRGLERGDAEALLEAIYAQQLHAELLESGRVRVQASTPCAPEPRDDGGRNPSGGQTEVNVSQADGPD